MGRPQWDQLIVEQGSVPPLLSDEQFRRWMTGRRIFVSSTMDEEMRPARSAARAVVQRWGGVTEMWEALAPRDQHPERAYLDGVERSHVFVLLLGHRYGKSDESGYAPTHKEANRAADLHIPRLLFEPAGVRGADRDGRLNDWVASLHRQISGNNYADPNDLAAQLEARLRELASAQESPWAKLGPIVFPGQVRRQSTDGATRFVVSASIRTRAVGRALAELTSWPRRASADRLTYGTASWPVDVVDVAVESPTLSTDEVTVTCQLARDRGGSAMASLGGITLTSQGRSVGPSEQAELWAARAVFGSAPPSLGRPVRALDDGVGGTDVAGGARAVLGPGVAGRGTGPPLRRGVAGVEVRRRGRALRCRAGDGNGGADRRGVPAGRVRPPGRLDRRGGAADGGTVGATAMEA